MPSPGTQSTSSTAKRQNLPPLDPHTNSYIPQDVNMLPPTVTIHKGRKILFINYPDIHGEKIVVIIPSTFIKNRPTTL